MGEQDPYNISVVNGPLEAELQEEITQRLTNLIPVDGVEVLTTYVWHMLTRSGAFCDHQHVTHELDEFLGDNSAPFAQWLFTAIVPRLKRQTHQPLPQQQQQPQQQPHQQQQQQQIPHHVYTPYQEVGGLTGNGYRDAIQNQDRNVYGAASTAGLGASLGQGFEAALAAGGADQGVSATSFGTSFGTSVGTNPSGQILSAEAILQGEDDDLMGGVRSPQMGGGGGAFGVGHGRQVHLKTGAANASFGGRRNHRGDHRRGGAGRGGSRGVGFGGGPNYGGSNFGGSNENNLFLDPQAAAAAGQVFIDPVTGQPLQLVPLAASGAAAAAGASGVAFPGVGLPGVGLPGVGVPGVAVPGVGGLRHQKLKKRCAKYPECPFGDECHFIHPTEMCTNWPHCNFGADCFYIHPEVACKYGLNCPTVTCCYTHPPGRDISQLSAFPGTYKNKTYVHQEQ